MARSATYLGVLMGHDITTRSIYDKAITDFRDRAVGLSPILGLLSVPKRVIVVNTWLISFFSYLSPFYLIPISILKEVEEILRPLIVPFNNGSAHKIELLYLPAFMSGLLQPLTSLWAKNVADLASQVDLSFLEGYARLGNSGIPTGSLLMSDHALIAAHDFMSDNMGKHWDGTYKVGWARGLTAKHLIRRTLVVQGYSVVFSDMLTRYIRKRLPCDIRVGRGRAENLVENGRVLWRSINSHQRYTHLSLVANALPTAVRRRSFYDSGMFPCLDCILCGSAYFEGVDGTGDHISHIFGSCAVACEARARFFVLIGLPVFWPSQVGADCWFSLSLLVFPPKLGGKWIINAIVIFNYALWWHREKHVRPNLAHQRGSASDIAIAVAHRAHAHWREAAPDGWGYRRLDRDLTKRMCVSTLSAANSRLSQLYRLINFEARRDLAGRGVLFAPLLVL